MSADLPFFEKYSIAPSPSRDYYGIKVFANQVTLYQWKISHGPHLSPIVRVIKFSELSKEKTAKELIEHVFGANVLRYLELAASSGPSTLLTLPKEILEKLVTYLNYKDISELLRTSTVSSQVFDRDPIWEILYKQSKASSDFSEMDKAVAANRGFKKLVQDHQVRSTAKKSIKFIDGSAKRHQTTTSKNDRVRRSASVTITEAQTQRQEHVTPVARTRQTTSSNPRKGQQPLKPLAKTGSQVQGQTLSLSRSGKSMSDEKSSIFANCEKFADKNIAIQACRGFKSIKETPTNKPNTHTKAMSKYKFVNEDREKTELLLPKAFFKSAIVQSDLDDNEVPDELPKSKSMMIESPKSSFCKRSSHAFGDSKVKAQAPLGPVGKGKKASESARKGHKSLSNAWKSARNDDRSDDSDESGMSFLMKRYLEASNEVARKLSECQRLANATKSSSVQADMSDIGDRKPLKKLHKYAPPCIDKPAARKKLR
ncbi:uncharacterized protein LOC131664789 [Phymastichus coffea]|uniref:uncharacterized protein LOC131664789 n=1 Tax=Phymastichus coffea TaxID=108790 RepID=UPI00273CDD01|nr:uncharacterized protein LOC131664789 [Phymastichus coffea]